MTRQLPDAVSDVRGTFKARAVAHEREDGSWEGWLEFIPAGPDASPRYTTPIETHQRDRVAMERWASGLTRVYAEGGLARARVQGAETEPPELLRALQEIVEALDRRMPNVKAAGETEIAAAAARLRASAIERIALLGGRVTMPR